MRWYIQVDKQKCHTFKLIVYERHGMQRSYLNINSRSRHYGNYAVRLGAADFPVTSTARYKRLST